MLVDSNILIYAINSASPKHKIAQDFLQNNVFQIEVAHQNIFETLRILTHPKFPSPMRVKDAIASLESILSICEVLSPDYRTHVLALELIKLYNLSSNNVFDAYLVATALTGGVDTIVTDNVRDIGRFKGIKVFNPFTTKQTN